MTIGVMRNFHNGDAITMFKELQACNFDPGEVNVVLGLRSIELARGPEAYPVIGQWEVLYVVWLYEPTWYEENQDRLVPIWPPVHEYLGTRGILLTVKEITEKRGLKTPVLVAHKEHIQRCFFIAKKIFGKPVAVDTDLYHYPTRWFDKKSVQKWTRGPWAWLRYEMMARFHHRLHGWM